MDFKRIIYLKTFIRLRPSLERLARFTVVYKNRTADIVYWAEESVLDDEIIYDDLQLRQKLIQNTQDMARGFNKAVEIASRAESRNS